MDALLRRRLMMAGGSPTPPQPTPTNYAGALSTWYCKKVAASSVSRYTDGHIEMRCGDAADLSGYAVSCFDRATTLWSVLSGKTIKIRIKTSSITDGQFVFAMFQSASITTLANNVSRRANLTGLTLADDGYYEQTFNCDLANFTVGTIVPTSSSTCGVACFSRSTTNMVYIYDVQVYDITPAPVPPITPYDAEIEYLESAGTGAYIDTGIECTGDLSVECRALWTAAGTNASIAGGIKDFGTSVYRHHFMPVNSGSKPVYWYQNSTSSTASITSTTTPSANTWHFFGLNADTGRWAYDGETGTVTTVAGTITTGRNYGVLGRIMSNGTIQQKASRFSYFRIRKNGVLVRDYIPVRIGSTGYLYDKVSGELHGNAGSGSFTLGPDL